MFLYKEEKIQRNTQGKRLGKDGADYNDTATCQGMSKIASNRQKLGKRHRTDSFPEPSEGTNCAWHLDFWTLASSTVRE